MIAFHHCLMLALLLELMNISDENLESILITSQELKEFDRGTLLNQNKS